MIIPTVIQWNSDVMKEPADLWFARLDDSIKKSALLDRRYRKRAADIRSKPESEQEYVRVRVGADYKARNWALVLFYHEMETSTFLEVMFEDGYIGMYDKAHFDMEQNASELRGMLNNDTAFE